MTDTTRVANTEFLTMPHPEDYEPLRQPFPALEEMFTAFMVTIAERDRYRAGLEEIVAMSPWASYKKLKNIARACLDGDTNGVTTDTEGEP